MAHPPDRAGRQQHVEQPRPQRSRHGQRQDQRGKGEEQVNHPHQGGVRPAAVVSGKHPHRQRDGHAEGQGGGGGQQGHARPVNNPAEGVPTQMVRAQQIFR